MHLRYPLTPKYYENFHETNRNMFAGVLSSRASCYGNLCVLVFYFLVDCPLFSFAPTHCFPFFSFPFVSCLIPFLSPGFLFYLPQFAPFLTVFPPASSCRIWKSSIFPPKLLDFNASKGLSPQSNTNVEIFVELLMTEAFSGDQLLG